MRVRARAQEIQHTTCYQRWNRTRADHKHKTDYHQLNIVTTILHVSSLISNEVFNTNTHRQWR